MSGTWLSRARSGASPKDADLVAALRALGDLADRVGRLESAVAGLTATAEAQVAEVRAEVERQSQTQRGSIQGRHTGGGSA